MDNIKVHVERFEENTNSLIVHFSGMEGDTTFQTPSYAFQTHNYDTDYLEDIIKILALTGKSYLEQEKQKAEFSKREKLLEQLKDINNVEYTVSISDITPPPPVNNGTIVDDLEIIV